MERDNGAGHRQDDSVTRVDHREAPWARPAPDAWATRGCVALVLLAVVLGPSACTITGAPEPADSPPATDAPTGQGCETGGTGTLEVTVAGLPDGLDARVTAAGTTLAGSGSLTAVGGEHEVVAEVVAEAAAADQPVVRRAYAAEAAVACVRDGQSTDVTVTYGVVPTSGMLWTGNDTGGDADLLGFTAADLATSGSPTAAAAAEARGRPTLAFDRTGNLWVAGRTTVDPPLLRYPAASLSAGGGREAHDIAIDSPVFRSSPNAQALAFDGAGGLWVAVRGGPIVMFTADQVATSGSPEPAVVLGAVTGSEAIAFDAAGNLWANDGGLVVRYDAARLAASTDDPPDLILELMRPPPVVVQLPSVWGMAFDSAGNLWVNHQGAAMVRLSPADQRDSGQQTLTPQVQINISVSALARGIAFDDEGGLWFAYDRGRLARLAPSQLTTGAHPGAPAAPATLIASPDVGFAGDITFYPAPAGLPLHHSLPGR
jgi:ligand-binding sensor domain-containing protein